jgi:GAF domain-containing protein
MRGVPTAETEADRERDRLVAEQAALRRVATLVAHGLPAGELFSAVTAEVGRLFGADLAGMSRYVAGDSVQALAAWSAEGEHPDVGGTWPLHGDNLSATLKRTGRPARLDDWAQAGAPIAVRVRQIGIRSTVACPIIVDGRTWGALLIHSKTEVLSAGTEMRMAGFTELVATAIANAQARADARRRSWRRSAASRRAAARSTPRSSGGSSAGAAARARWTS